MIEPVVMRLELPPGVVGPDGVSIDVRCYLVPHSTGVVLVDAGPPDSCDAIESGLARVHRTWSDVTDLVLTHAHFDHIGGLAEAADRAQSAQLWAGADDVAGIEVGEGLVVKPLQDGDRVRDLRVVYTPGHTPGHVSLLHEPSATLLIGDLIGSVDGVLSAGPEAFTADSQLSRRSLSRVLDLGAERIVFSHGPEVPEPHRAIADYLAG
jgi:glyoxylase-like metal-dependent hydrolase (beta-lactamase superfamily II)